MATEPCPQCGTQLQAGQEVCPNCGFRRATGGGFRTGETGMRPIPQVPQQQGGAPPPPPPAQPGASPTGATPPQTYQPPAYTAAAPPRVGAPPPVTYGANVVPSPWTQPEKRAVFPILALIGVGLVVAGAFLPWLGDKFLGLGGDTLNSFDANVTILFDPNASSGGFKLGFLLLILAGVALLSLFVPAASSFRRIVGIAVIVVAALYVVTIIRALNDQDALSVSNFFKGAAIGLWVTLLGGILIATGRQRTSA